jgi:hypothetical protein
MAEARRDRERLSMKGAPVDDPARPAEPMRVAKGGAPDGGDGASRSLDVFGRPERDEARPGFANNLAAADQSQMLPPEFEVSPALLTALQRKVVLQPAGIATVQDAVVRLTEAADVFVQVDPSVPALAISVDGAQDEKVPLWVVLETVAKQGSLQIYPAENQLVLRFADVREERLLAQQRGLEREAAGQPDALRPIAPPASRAEQPRAPKPDSRPSGPVSQRPRVPTAAKALPMEKRPLTETETAGSILADKDGEAAGRLPDRRVWPAEWGSLPERGFAQPTQEEFDALVRVMNRR